MGRVLLVDTNRAAYPIYLALQEMGHEVWVVGGRPEDPLAGLAENYHMLDYADVRKLSSFIEKSGFDFLVPGCTDLSYKVCAEIGAGRFPGLDTLEQTDVLNTKSRFRRFAEEKGLSIPEILTPEAAVEVSEVIIKPVDSFSGKGMRILTSPSSKELAESFEEARQSSPTGTALIEKFVRGQLFSHSAFLKDGEVEVDFIVQEDCTTNQFAVDTSRVCFNIPETMRTLLRKDASAIARELGLTEGLLHVQFIADGSQYWIIEATRRCPGDIYASLIEFSTGYRYAKAYCLPFLGERLTEQPQEQEKKWIIRHTVTSKSGQSLWGLKFSSPVNIRLFVPLCRAGEYVAQSPNGRVGIFFFECASEGEQDSLYEKLIAGGLYVFS